MIECTECYRLSNPIIFNCLEDLEIHLTNDHFKLNIYECGYCPYAKFPTETTLVEHYNIIHNITSNIQVKYTLDPTSIEARRQIRQILSGTAVHIKQELLASAQEQQGGSQSPISLSESNHSSGCDLIVDDTNDEEMWIVEGERRRNIKVELDLVQPVRSTIQAISSQEAAAVVNAIAQVSPPNGESQQMPVLGLESTSEISPSLHSESTSWDLPAPPPTLPPVHVDVSGFASAVCSQQSRLNFVPVPSTQAIKRRMQERQMANAGRTTTARLVSCLERSPVKNSDTNAAQIKSNLSSSRATGLSVCSQSMEDDQWLLLGNTPDHRKSDRQSVQPDYFCAGPSKEVKKRQTVALPVKKRGRPKGYKVKKPEIAVASTSTTFISTTTASANTTPSRKSTVSIGKKARKVRLARDKGLPPRPISAFLHFSNAHRAIIRAKSLAQGVSYRELAKQMWEGLENKGYWKSKEREDCSRYKSAKVEKKVKEISCNF